MDIIIYMIFLLYPASKFLVVAALCSTYDCDYVHDDLATRNGYAHPNILPLSTFHSNEDSPCEIPHPHFQFLRAYFFLSFQYVINIDECLNFHHTRTS